MWQENDDAADDNDDRPYWCFSFLPKHWWAWIKRRREPTFDAEGDPQYIDLSEDFDGDVFALHDDGSKFDLRNAFGAVDAQRK